MEYQSSYRNLEVIIIIAELIFPRIFDEQTILCDMTSSLTIPFFKKGNNRKRQNYTGLNLLRIVLKLFYTNKTRYWKITKNICDSQKTGQQQTQLRKFNRI